ncbi:MAG: hypothetical protein DME42_06630 [Verrucomicrobia bacterium]|nr:MAG: hypothetical protein DME42_06630 [Verrucomicrobiota bacterium]
MAEERTQNSTSSEQSQSRENITVPPISKPAAGAAAGAVLGSVAGPVGAVVGGVIGAIAGKSAATGENQRHLRKSANLRGAQRRRKPGKAKPAKRAALAGRDRRHRVAVAKAKAAARHHAARGAVGGNRVRVPGTVALGKRSTKSVALILIAM